MRFCFRSPVLSLPYAIFCRRCPIDVVWLVDLNWCGGIGISLPISGWGDLWWWCLLEVRCFWWRVGKPCASLRESISRLANNLTCSSFTCFRSFLNFDHLASRRGSSFTIRTFLSASSSCKMPLQRRTSLSRASYGVTSLRTILVSVRMNNLSHLH